MPDFAQGFKVEYHKSYKLVTVNQPWENANQNLTYVFFQCGTPAPQNYPEATIVEIPVRRIIAMSTTYLPHLEKLDHLDQLVGVGDRRLIYSPIIREKISQGLIKEVGNLQIDNEIVVGLQPDVILNYRLENSESSGFDLLESLGLKIVLDAAHLEPSPLGRAEWLKFTALLLNEEAKANQEFTSIAQRYQALKEKVAKIEKSPLVLSGAPYQGVWYVPAGKSFVAQLFRDANVNYPWYDTDSRLSLSLDFEAVLNKAKKADVWLNVDQEWQNKNDLLRADKRYELFTAVQNNQVYAVNARVTEDGGNDFWEGGVINPDLVLADLIKMVHPEILPEYQLFYYRHLE